MTRKDSIESRTRYLTALAAGLCNDAGVELEVRDGASWGWDPARRVIAVPAADLRRKGQSYCAGVIAHEVGHIWISRYLAFREVEEASSSVAILMNALEDPRVDGWMQLRYPGTAAWYRELTEEPCDSVESLPEFLRFCLECVREPSQGWEPSEDKGISTEVRAALADTRDARRAYVAQVPAADLSYPDSGTELAARYRENAWSRLTARARRHLPSRREQHVRLHALRAFDLAKKSIFPRALPLLNGDVERLGGHLTRDDRLAAKARAALRDSLAPVLRELARLAGQKGGKTSSKALSPLARKALEAVMEETMRPSNSPFAQEFGGRLRPLRSPFVLTHDVPEFADKPGSQRRSGQELHALPETPLPELKAERYERAADDIRSQIDELTGSIEAILLPRRRLGRRVGYASGRGIDLTRLMQYQADPRRWDELWWRTTLPERRDAAILLLIDLSGSMSGGKDRAAMLGTILFVESLERLGIPCAILGFQDRLIPIRGFEQPFDSDVRKRIHAIPLEIQGTHPGGNNSPKYNDDGPCLSEAADILNDRSEQDRILVVISDGSPAGRSSSDKDLHRAIRKITAPPYELQLLGVGLGSGTEHVAQFYPQFIADVPIDQFATRIAELLASILLSPDTISASRGNR